MCQRWRERLDWKRTSRIRFWDTDGGRIISILSPDDVGRVDLEQTRLLLEGRPGGKHHGAHARARVDAPAFMFS